MTVAADVPSTTDLLGKSVTDLQENVVVSDDSITGTLKAVTGYTGFTSDPAMQEGHFLVLHCVDENADYITVEVVGGTSGPVRLDEDGIIIDYIASTDQSIRVVSYKDNEALTTKTYSLTGLTLA